VFFTRHFLVLIPALMALPAGVTAATRNVVVATNTVVRVLASNLTPNSQEYEPPAIRILQALKPDVVAMQEFNYSNNTPAQLRAFIDTAFGTNFQYYRETNSGYSIPNGIVSRFPIAAAGSWDDTLIGDRGFAWARLDLPGSNDLWVVSVHLKASSSSASTRSSQATNLKNLIAANIPSNAWLVVAGDMNLENRSEAALTTLKTILSDAPVPTDQSTNANTNTGRTKPYDLVLPGFTFATNFTPSVVGGLTFSNGLVFDSRVFAPLAAVPPVQAADSGIPQHMAVIKDFRVQHTVTNTLNVPEPALSLSRSNVLRWNTVAGVHYTIEHSTNLPAWTTSATVTATSTVVSWTNGPAGGARRFYRVGF
jgi:endonuclease/exonuclease/phosphatase family metal-dependent hydrolase